MYMTDWEKQMMAAQMMRDPRQSPAVPDPGMVTQTAGAPNPEAASVEGQQGAIDNQMAYANMLRGRSAPQGREVGPSGIYMGPNIGETLAHAGEQALGGYLAGKANKKQAGLDETLARRKQAEIDKEEARYQEGVDIKKQEMDAAAKRLQADQLWRQQREDERLARQKVEDEKAANLAEHRLLDEAEDEIERGVERKRDRRDDMVKASQDRLEQAKQDKVIRERLEQADRRLERQEEAAETAAEKELARNVKSYGVAMRKSGIPKGYEHFKAIDGLMSDYVDKDAEGNYVLKEGVKDVPGVGGTSNLPIVGDVVTYVDDAFSDGPGKDIRQAAQKVYNNEIKTESGTAVSGHEWERQMKALGIDMWSDADNFIKGLNLIKKGYDAEAASVGASFDDDVIEKYNKNMNRTSDAKGDERKTIGGKDYVKIDGKWYEA